MYLDDSGALDTMEREIRDGLTGRPKTLPSKYFYDERGSELFERITELPEYYLTRAEQSLLERLAEEIARLTRPEELVELGPGSAKKTDLLIEAGRSYGTLKRYVPVEVSQEIAEASAHRLAADHPGLAVHAVIGDFESHLGEIPEGRRRLFALMGSTVGNFSDERAAELLENVALMMDPDDWFLLGVDLVKEPSVLEAAYNDSQGVTAEFNRNILNVINRHLGADFDPRQFEHVAYYNEAASRIESYLRSKRDQRVTLDEIDLDVAFDAGEMVRTEISRKFTEESTGTLLRGAGLNPEHWRTDEQELFALSLSRR